MAANPVEAFCRALWRHDHQTVAALAARVNPNGADRFGYTPLLMAAQYGELPLVTQLVRRGAEVDQKRTHLTPITYAARRGAMDMVEFLRGQGATESVVTWLFVGDERRLRRALQADPALARLRDEQGRPLVHHAALTLKPRLLELVLARGAAVGETDGNGETALHQVADLRRAPPEPVSTMAKLLLQRGADPNARNWDHVTPLHQAVRARNLAVAEVLLAHGANVNARDKNRGSTPLRRAVSGTGASATAGTSALMAPLTRLLLEHGADPDARDRRGVPVHASARAPDVVAVLEEFRKRGKKGASARRVRRR